MNKGTQNKMKSKQLKIRTGLSVNTCLEHIRRPWKKTLIIKLLGHNIGFHLLQRKLKETWKPKSPLEFIAIEKGYFLAKFLSSDDYEFGKYEGPWMLGRDTNF